MTCIYDLSWELFPRRLSGFEACSAIAASGFLSDSSSGVSSFFIH
jgi:hypothetical protein